MRDRLDLQFQDTYYRIVLQAHNELGFSSESSIIIKTKKGKDIYTIVLFKTYFEILDPVRRGTVISTPILDSSNAYSIKFINLRTYIIVAISLFLSLNFYL